MGQHLLAAVPRNRRDEMNDKTKKILQLMHETPKHIWRKGYMRESDLGRVSHAYLQQMYDDGLIDGVGLRDDKGTGNYKESRLWKITEKGMDALFGDKP